MTFFCFSIDTECDMPNWKPLESPKIENIKELPKLHDLLDKYEIRPTYLITYPIADLPLGIDTIKSLIKRNNCEIGAHLHPWTTPPISKDEIENATFPFQLSNSLHKLKLINQTKKIQSTFKLKPISYRAGRFGQNAEGLKIIEELGYKVDSSITPLTNWGTDFRQANLEPYFPDFNNICKPGSSRVLEVPVTIDANLPKFIKKYYRYNSETIMAGLKYIGLKKIMLWPPNSSSKDMIKLSARLIYKKSPVINLISHSNELSISSSPFHKNSTDLVKYYKKLEEFFAFIRKSEIQSLTLSEFYQEYIKVR